MRLNKPTHKNKNQRAQKEKQVTFANVLQMTISNVLTIFILIYKRDGNYFYESPNAFQC